MPQELSLFGNQAPIAFDSLLANLAVGVVLSLVLRGHFQRFGSTLSNREEFTQVLPFVLMTTVLVITIVKSSLALSLGLVGALSIVRFRTPIKEPEELAYLFIAIAMGLGLGANQTLATVVAGGGILAMMAVFKWARRDAKDKNLFLSLDWPVEKEGETNLCLKRMNEVIGRHVRTGDLRRFDMRGGAVEATYFLDIAGAEKLSELTDDLRDNFPSIGVTFLDQNQLPSI